jgi:phenylalanyl-tRNA synthetase beta chain
MKLPVFWLRDYLSDEPTGKTWSEILTDACLRWDLRPEKDAARMLAQLFTFAGFACEGVEGEGDEAILELDVLSNRPDAQCVLGLAREAAAILRLPLREPDCRVETSGPGAETFAKIRVEDATLCPRYTARIICGVKVGPSPEWLAKRLRSLGLTPRNNIVDATNFVMFELNHPLHAFDLNFLSGREIVVRRAREKEAFTPLYDQVPPLTPETLLIADAERGVAVGGIIGGKGSEVTPATTDILLEAATFQPAHIRRSTRRLRVSTDSSFRFERGVDAEGVERASARAAKIILETAGGHSAPGLLDSRPQPTPMPEIRLRASRLNALCGVSLPPHDAQRCLTTMGCEILRTEPERVGSSSVLTVRPPTWRRADLAREADLIEEVIRLCGYNLVPPETAMRARIPPRGGLETAMSDARRLFTALGYFEVVTDSLTDPAWPAPAVWTAKPQAALSAASVMREDHSVLRHNLSTSLLAVRRHNQRQRTGEVRIFECGRVFLPAEQARPNERNVLGILDDRGFAALADALRRLPAACSLSNAEVAVAPAAEPNQNDYFIPETACRAVLRVSGEGKIEEKELGVIGVASDALCRFFELRKAPAVCELDLELLAALPTDDSRLKPLPMFPEVVRDVAMVVDERVPWAAVEAYSRRVGGQDPLRDAESAPHFLSVYRGKQVGAGKKSMAFSLVYRVPNRTLTDEEVNQAHQTFVDGLLKEFNAALRA